MDGATAGPLWGGHVAEAAWQSVFASARNLDGWANCLTMAVESVGAVAPARVEAILLGMAAGGYIHRREQEELLRGAAAAGLSAEDQATANERARQRLSSTRAAEDQYALDS